MSYEYENPVFALLEGACPTCHADVTITHIGGLKEEVEGWTLPEGVVPILHGRGVPDHIGILGIDFICPNGHKHYVQKNKWGDWS